MPGEVYNFVNNMTEKSPQNIDSDTLMENKNEQKNKEQFFYQEVKDYFGIDLTEFDLRVQMWFMNFVKDGDNKKFARVKDFIEKYGQNSLVTFVAMEYGDSNGERILSIGENLPYDEARELFDRFGEVVEVAGKVEERIKNILQAVKNSDFFGAKILESLLRQAENYLVAVDDLEKEGKAFVYLEGKFKQVKQREELFKLMDAMMDDLNEFLSTVNDFDQFKERGIEILDKYLFDTKNIEKIKKQTVKVYVSGSDEFKEKIKQWMNEENIIFLDQDEFRSFDIAPLLGKYIDEPGAFGFLDYDYFNRPPDKIIEVEQRRKKRKEFLADFLKKNKDNFPDAVIFEDDDLRSQYYSEQEYIVASWRNQWIEELRHLISNNESVPDYIYERLKIIDEYYNYMPLRVVVGDDKLDVSLRYKNNKDTKLFSSTYDFVMNRDNYDIVLLGMQDAVYTKKHKPDIKFDEANYQAYEKEAFVKEKTPYELNLSNPDTLELIEEKTADTGKTLERLFDLIGKNNYQKVLDLGVGEGRIAVPLAMKGVEVLGVDQVERELAKIDKRVKQEIGKKGNSWKHLEELISSGKVKESDFDFSLDNVRKRIKTKTGNFFDLNNVLDKDDKFDLVTFTWHTFCETGTIDNQRDVLVQVYNNLNPGGSVYIEIPDRTVGAYKFALYENSRRHPEEPIGVSRDSTCLTPGVACVYDEQAPPRFFPGRTELTSLLESIGFVDVEIDTYLITSHDKESNEYLEVKELVVTAKKPSSK